MDEDLIEALKVPDRQRAIRKEPYSKALWFWRRQAEGNQKLAWRHLEQQWKERDAALGKVSRLKGGDADWNQTQRICELAPSNGGLLD